jgi:hypothetical protein
LALAFGLEHEATSSPLLLPDKAAATVEPSIAGRFDLDKVECVLRAVARRLLPFPLQ